MKYEVIDRSHGGGRLVLDPTAIVARRVSIDVSADVTIEARAQVHEDVLILTHEHEPMRRSPLSIGVGARIGARAIVLYSCNAVGAGAVVGAGSVVTHDVPAHELWAGNPARFIRRLAQ